MREGLGVIRARRRARRLPRLVVIALGTNATVSRGDISAALRILGPKRLLGLVTPRETGGVSGSDTRVVRQAGRRHPRRVLVLDWVAYSRGHPGWFAPDGIHLGPGGAAGIARLLASGIRRAFELRAVIGGPGRGGGRSPGSRVRPQSTPRPPTGARRRSGVRARAARGGAARRGSARAG